jgi:hypothetical protein
MLASGIPYKFATPWAVDATTGYITSAIPATTTGAAASQQLGFPPITAAPTGAGGIPPNIADFNGFGLYVTAWNQWQQAGGPIYYDATFSSNIGGYPQGAVLLAANRSTWWMSTVDNNTSDPDTGGANWISFGGGRLLNIQKIVASATYTNTSGTNEIIIAAAGPGGPGGGLASTNSSQIAASSGGAAGSYIMAKFTSGFTGGISVVIGSANAPVSGGSASIGTNTTFGGTMLIAPAGTPGFSGGASSPGGALAGVGPAAAPSTTGTLLSAIQGAPGTGPVAYSTTLAAMGGAGGSSPFGTGGIARGSSDGFASDGTGYGSGGGGCAALTGSASSRPGGAATNGYMMVFEFS